MIVGIGHRDGVGKSTFARMLREELTGLDVGEVSFAGPVKSLAYDLFRDSGIQPGPFYEEHPHLKNTPLPCGKTPRDFWKQLGDGMREIWTDVWAKQAVGAAFDFKADVVLMPDVRKKNEVAAIHKAGGVLIEVENPRVKDLPGKSFSELGDFEAWDYRVFNVGGMDRLRMEAMAVAAWIRSRLD
jgi:hypothetical protein